MLDTNLFIRGWFMIVLIIIVRNRLSYHKGCNVFFLNKLVLNVANEEKAVYKVGLFYTMCMYYKTFELFLFQERLDRSPTTGRMDDFIFRLYKAIQFLLIEFHYVVFHLLYSANMLCLLLLYLITFEHPLLIFHLLYSANMLCLLLLYLITFEHPLLIFHLLYSANMLCLLLLYLITFEHPLLLFHRRISTVLSQMISHGMWLLAWQLLLSSSVYHCAFMHLHSGYYDYYC